MLTYILSYEIHIDSTYIFFGDELNYICIYSYMLGCLSDVKSNFIVYDDSFYLDDCLFLTTGTGVCSLRLAEACTMMLLSKFRYALRLGRNSSRIVNYE